MEHQSVANPSPINYIFLSSITNNILLKFRNLEIFSDFFQNIQIIKS